VRLSRQEGHASLSGDRRWRREPAQRGPAATRRGNHGSWPRGSTRHRGSGRQARNQTRREEGPRGRGPEGPEERPRQGRNRQRGVPAEPGAQGPKGPGPGGGAPNEGPNANGNRGPRGPEREGAPHGPNQERAPKAEHKARRTPTARRTPRKAGQSRPQKAGSGYGSVVSCLVNLEATRSSRG